MDFGLSEEQQAIFDMAHGFGQEHIAPFARAVGGRWHHSQGAVAKGGRPGAGRHLCVGRAWRVGVDRLDATLVFEALAMACPSVGSFLSIHNMCGGMIDKFASPEVKAAGCPRCAAWTRCFLLPDRTGVRVRRRRLAHPGRQDQRRLPHERHQGLHLGRRLFRCLCRDVPHRRGWAQGHFHPDRRGWRPRPVVWRAGGQDGLAASPPRRCSSTIAWCRWTTASGMRGAGLPMPWRGWMAGG
jgi:hypothetical protein